MIEERSDNGKRVVFPSIGLRNSRNHGGRHAGKRTLRTLKFTPKWIGRIGNYLKNSFFSWTNIPEWAILSLGGVVIKD